MNQTRDLSHGLGLDDSVSANLNDHDNLLALDAANRKRALDIASFIVEAPAGAGKTELLTQRYLRLLQTVDAPEEMIAITFTNKAASEMRLRIMDSLQLAATGQMPEAPHKQLTFELARHALQRSYDLGWNLLSSPGCLRVVTIDSLCGHLAKQLPLLSRFGSQPSVLDDASEHYEEAARRCLDHLADAVWSSTIEEVLRYFDFDTDRVRSLLVQMLAKRDQWLGYSQQGLYNADACARTLEILIQQEIAEVAKVLDARVQAILMPIARYAAEQKSADATMDATAHSWDRYRLPLSTEASDLPLWLTFVDLLLTGKDEWRKAFNTKMGLPTDASAKPHKEALQALIEDLSGQAGAQACIARLRTLPYGQTAAERAMIGSLCRLLNLAVAELWLVFQASAEVDFVEISQRALQALQEGDGEASSLALRLDYCIRHLLVDEFQDTSPGQIRLLEALTAGWQAGDGRTLFLVGDPMQSIYRFRKANVGLFLRVADSGIGTIRLHSLKLWRNNRSHPALVAWVNQAFPKVFPAFDNSARGAICYRPFVATRPDIEDSGVFVYPLLSVKAVSVAEETLEMEHQSEGEAASDSQLPMEKSAVRRNEANQIIKIIRTTWQARPEATIAVLVRARNHLAVLVREIRKHHRDLPFQAVEIEALQGRQVIQDMLALTYALHQRADRLHWVAILRAPWCGLTLADVHALLHQSSGSVSILRMLHDPLCVARLSFDGQQRISHLREVMTLALASQGRSRTSRWLYGTWLMLGGAHVLWQPEDVQDVQAFLDCVDMLEQQGAFSLEALQKRVAKLYAAPSGEARLQFMTIHKSKGLEFDTVILPALESGFQSDEPQLMLWEELAQPVATHGQVNTGVALVAAPLTPKWQRREQAGEVTAYDYLRGLEKARAECESARLLYVAVTRAQRCLHLLGVAQYDRQKAVFANPRASFLRLLWPLLEPKFVEAVRADTPAAVSEETGSLLQQDFVPHLVRLSHTQIPKALQMPAPSVGSTTSIHAALNTRLDMGTQAIGAMQQPIQIEADIGTLVHRYLQWIAEDGLAAWSIERVAGLATQMQDWFLRMSHSKQVAENAASRVVQLLQSTLQSEAGRWVLKDHEEAASELALESVSGSASAPVLNKKVIDRTFVDGGQRWVIDYKSTALSGVLQAALREGEDAAMKELQQMAQQYLLQLVGYRDLLLSQGLPVRMAVLFLEVGLLIELHHAERDAA